MVDVSVCDLCGAVVAASAVEQHRDWHVAHGLHAATCSLLQTRIAQRSAGCYYREPPCDCGLE